MLMQNKMNRLISGYTGCKFYDLARIEPSQRRAKSSVIQFYSSINNIGNFTPVLGIQKMLGQTTDTWCMHDKTLDFEFINRHYQCVIIGGAGLLSKCFEPFWQKALQECKLPMIIWGVGACFADHEVETVDRSIVMQLSQRCDLINVRDDLTADYYELEQASITACPTVVYLEDFQRFVQPAGDRVLFSSHEELVPSGETATIKEQISQVCPNFKYTNNLQRRFNPLNKILTQDYCKSRVVVTTRLHGAIIAYGLGIPYIAIPRDEKLREFHRLYGNGNGVSTENVNEITSVLQREKFDAMQSIAIAPVLEFGNRARGWVQSVATSNLQIANAG